MSEETQVFDTSGLVPDFRKPEAGTSGGSPGSGIGRKLAVSGLVEGGMRQEEGWVSEEEAAVSRERLEEYLAPSLFAGVMDGVASLIDIPALGASWAAGKALETFGLGETDFARGVKNPALFGDLLKEGFEIPQVIEEAITGEEADWTRFFDAKPREARNNSERFWGDLWYIAGTAHTFPSGLAGALGKLRAPTSQLLRDAADRGVGSNAARKHLSDAQEQYLVWDRRPISKEGLVEMRQVTRHPRPGEELKIMGANARQGAVNAVTALGNAARDYANRYTLGLRTAPKRTLWLEQKLALAAGFGFAAPRAAFGDEEGRILVGPGTREVLYDFDEEGNPVPRTDLEAILSQPKHPWMKRTKEDFVLHGPQYDLGPTLQILGAGVFPSIYMYRPAQVGSAAYKGSFGDVKEGAGALMAPAKTFGESFFRQFTKAGKTKMAGKALASAVADEKFIRESFIPAVRRGVFTGLTQPPPLKLLGDNKLMYIGAYGGVQPDLSQALKLMGHTDVGIATLDKTLQGMKPFASQARLTEMERRAKALDTAFDKMKFLLAGDVDLAPGKTVQEVQASLQADLDNTAIAAQRAATEARWALEPLIGPEAASRLAVSVLKGSELRSREVSEVLWHKDMIGTDEVPNPGRLGDWALEQIQERARNYKKAPGIGLLFELAGAERLAKLGIGRSGRPLTGKDLRGVTTATAEAETPLTPESLEAGGMFDVFGPPGTVQANPVKILEIQNHRSMLTDISAGAASRGNTKLSSGAMKIVDFIDDEVLSAESFADLGLSETSLRNLETARGYTRNQKVRFGPKSKIGKLIFYNDDPDGEGLLGRLITAGDSSGRAVDQWRKAITEPPSPLRGFRYNPIQMNAQGELVSGEGAWRRTPPEALDKVTDPDVIETFILEQFVKSNPIAESRLTPSQVTRFLKKWGPAVDRVPGLRDRFLDLKSLQEAADIKNAQLSSPTNKELRTAIANGATEDTILAARALKADLLKDTQLLNTASEFLNADAQQIVRKQIDTLLRGAGKYNQVQRAKQLRALLDKSEGEFALQGFRMALWRDLRKRSLIKNAETGETQPGVDTQELVNTVTELRPFYEEFWTPTQMEYLDELVKATPLQKIGVFDGLEISDKIKVRDVLAADFGTEEAVRAGGRSAGAKVFGAIGINTLVATGMGGRTAGYLFTKMGQEKIFKLVEESLRDPVVAARALEEYYNTRGSAFRRYNRLYESVSDPAERAKFYREQAGATKSAASSMFRFILDKFLNYTYDVVQRTARFGLLGLNAKLVSERLEKDWLSGPPFQYDFNKNRWLLEKNSGPEEGDAIGQGEIDSSVVPKEREGRRYAMLPRSRAERSPYAMVRPGIPQPPLIKKETVPTRTAPLNPETMARGQQLFGATDAVFAKNGGYIDAGAGSGMGRLERSKGILSIKRKGRQLVG